MVNGEWFGGVRFILMSQSPRRKELLQKLGLPFQAMASDAEESYAQELKGNEIPVYLSRVKANSYSNKTSSRQSKGNNGDAPANKSDAAADKDDTPCIIAADTIVWADNKALGKPHDADEARKMLHILSGNTHHVITGVTLKHGDRTRSFYEETEVEFYTLTDSEINYYIEAFHPLDKAGAYGIQEWIGMVGVRRISGSFYNVMGLPVARLYHELREFLSLKY